MIVCVVFGIDSARNAARKGSSTHLGLPFLAALLALLIPNTTQNRPITDSYTAFSQESAHLHVSAHPPF